MMILQRLMRRWGRNSLTILAIAISFAMLLSLTSVALGLHRASDERLGESPRDIVISSIGLVPSIEDSHLKAEELKSDPNVSASMPLLTLLGRLAFDVSGQDVEPSPDPTGEDGHIGGEHTETVGLVGIVPDMTSEFMNEKNELFIRSDVLRFNDWFSQEMDPYHESNYTTGWTGEIILDRTIMDDNSLEIGDIVYYISKDGNITSSFRILGTLETSLVGGGLTADLIGGVAVVHLSELQYASGYHSQELPEGERSDLSTAIYVDLKKDILSPEQQKEITLDISKEYQGLDVTNKESRLYRIEEEVLVLEVFSVSVAFTSLSIGVLFLSSIMMIEVEERRAEISIMRSIGISRRTIFVQIIKDSLFLALVGTVIGVIPGYFGSNAINGYLQDLYGLRVGFAEFDPLMVVGGFTYVMVLVLIFSLVPAFRATTVVPRVGLAAHYNR